MKACPICDKSRNRAGGYSNKVRATQYNPTGRRQQKPNLQWAALPDGGRIKICTSCLKKGKHLKYPVAVKKKNG